VKNGDLERKGVGSTTLKKRNGILRKEDEKELGGKERWGTTKKKSLGR